MMHEKYICSSEIVKPLILANRAEWCYEILAIGPAWYIRQLETKFLLLLDAKNDPMSFNQSNASFDPGNRLGRKESLETRRRKSAARIGDKNPMYGKRGENSPHWGKKHTEESKEKTREKLKAYAKNRPSEHNLKISAALTGNPKVGLFGERNPRYGKPASENAKLMSKIKNSGANNPMRKPEHQKICEYCNKSVAKNHYTMYHGDKCESKSTANAISIDTVEQEIFDSTKV
jgi:hypothetical protein